MTHILLPEEKTRRLTFYLSMEEYLAENCTEDLFFIWRVKPTVIFGRNQEFEAEVNVEYCEANNIQYYRRKSGGGCVYADEGNIMLSYITPSTAVDDVFSHYLDTLVITLQGLGIDAVKSEHNDILIGDKKVSGNASFKKEKASIVHGTILYDVDVQRMQESITPTVTKLQKHGIQSVRQRVVNLKEKGLNLSIQELEKYLISSFCNAEKMLSLYDVNAIKQIEKSYLNPEFIKCK